MTAQTFFCTFFPYYNFAEQKVNVKVIQKDIIKVLLSDRLMDVDIDKIQINDILMLSNKFDATPRRYKIFKVYKTFSHAVIIAYYYPKLKYDQEILPPFVQEDFAGDRHKFNPKFDPPEWLDHVNPDKALQEYEATRAKSEKVAEAKLKTQRYYDAIFLEEVASVIVGIILFLLYYGTIGWLIMLVIKALLKYTG